ncbi:hypothetical protein B4U84_25835 [Westiellopsis prolifica IICB1]|nr:hypothetical protein B4U84_25835 [Westiellopsis prolifica IICB1]
MNNQNLQYIDYVFWQSKMLASSRGEQLEAYWKKQLAAPLTPINLPTDRPHSPLSSFRGDVHLDNLNTSLISQLKKLAKAEETNTFTIVLATFCTLILRLSGQEEILIGVPLTSSWPEIEKFEGVVGMMANPVICRVNLTGNITFKEVLAQVHHVLEEAERYRDYPFSLVSEWIRTQQEYNGSSFLKVAFSAEEQSWYQPNDSLVIRREELRMKPYLLGEQQGGAFDLYLTMIEVDQQIQLCWKYSTDLFEAKTIARMAEQFQTLLSDIIANRQQQISKLSLLTKTEQYQLLVKWNANKSDYLPNKCIHQLFEEQVKQTPNATAVVFENEQLTYRELNSRANQLAHYLQALGVKSEMLVGICVERSLEMIVGLLGILKAGGAYLPLDPAYPQERLAYVLEDSQIPVLLTQNKLLQKLPSNKIRVVCLDADSIAISEFSNNNPVSNTGNNNLAYVIYTSGSTGNPKGVMIEHRSLVNFTLDAIVQYGFNQNTRALQFASISFDAAGEEIYPCLTSGGTVVLKSNEMLASIPTFMQKCQDYSITILNIPTAYWHLLVTELAANPKLAFPDCIHTVIIGGEKANPQLIAKWQKYIGDFPLLFHTYGPTEATITTTTYKLPPKAWICDNSQTDKFTQLPEVPIGRAITNVTTYVLDSYQQLVPIGVVGELHIGGVCLARGYLNRSDITEQKFIPNPFSSEPGARLYKTGDLVRYRTDGNLEFVGRIDHQVKIRGFRIELGEIEVALTTYPDVREAVVLARKDQSGSNYLVAYVVPYSILTPSLQHTITQQLRSYLSQKLPDYMIPSSFVLMESFPLTQSGKVDRKKLPTPVQVKSEHETVSTLLSASILPDQRLSTTESVIAAIWSEVFELEQVGIHDNFFELGGHSLLAIKLINRISNKLSVELTVPNLIENPTIAQIAQVVARAQQAESKDEYCFDKAVDLKAEAVLDSTIQFQGSLNKEIIEPKSIFLTGATGFIGSYLLAELLQKTNSDIYCLVRCPHNDYGKQRIEKYLKSSFLWNTDYSFRIIPVLGDLAKPLFGLTKQKFEELAKHIDVIYHNGAWVNFVYPYSTLKAANVLGTQEILRLASFTKIKPVHFISTLSVFSRNYSQIKQVLEIETPEFEENLENGYAQSKWVAEQLVKIAKNRGLPACIYRLGTVIGSSSTGVMDKPDDFFLNLLKGCIQLKKAPSLQIAFNLTPVNYVSQAIVHLSRQKKSLGKLFHVINPTYLPSDKLFNAIRSLGYPLEQISYEKWLTELKSEDEDTLENALHQFLPDLSSEDDFYEHSLHYDYHHTLEELATTSIACPPIDEKLLNKYFSYFQKTGFLPSPPTK